MKWPNPQPPPTRRKVDEGQTEQWLGNRAAAAVQLEQSVREREQQLNLNEKSIRPSFCVLPLMVPPPPSSYIERDSKDYYLYV